MDHNQQYIIREPYQIILKILSGGYQRKNTKVTDRDITLVITVTEILLKVVRAVIYTGESPTLRETTF